MKTSMKMKSSSKHIFIPLITGEEGSVLKYHLIHFAFSGIYFFPSPTTNQPLRKRKLRLNAPDKGRVDKPRI